MMLARLVDLPVCQPLSKVGFHVFRRAYICIVRSSVSWSSLPALYNTLFQGAKVCLVGYEVPRCRRVVFCSIRVGVLIPLDCVPDHVCTPVKVLCTPPPACQSTSASSLMACTKFTENVSAMTSDDIHRGQLQFDLRLLYPPILIRLRFGDARGTPLPRRSHYGDLRRNVGSTTPGHRWECAESVRVTKN